MATHAQTVWVCPYCAHQVNDVSDAMRGCCGELHMEEMSLCLNCEENPVHEDYERFCSFDCNQVFQHDNCMEEYT